MEKNKTIGLLGPKQIDSQERIHTSCRKFLNFPYILFYRTPLNRFTFSKKIIDNHLLSDLVFN
ncbi:hypothetical protein KJA15_00010 [Patescibacteria group bacterium]|nr:hypothetical protein [Patescibacteria group bacterium]